MKKISFFTVLFLISSYTLPLLSQTAFIGDWQGSLKIQGMALRINFHISNVDGSLKATMDSPDQGVNGIPVGKITIEKDHVIMEVPVTQGKYTGTINKVKNLITGTWSQGGRDLELCLKPLSDQDKVKRPQEPKPPFPYKSEDVSFRNKTANLTFAGTLTYPESGGPFQAAVLITGSGAQNRNEELFQHKPFLVIADYLTRRGIAVLRVDDRGVGGSEGNIANSTTNDFAGDVHAAMLYLRTRKEIDPTRIGLIGHSEGGVVAPIVAADYRDVAFIVLLAGTGLPGEEILYMQGELILKANGATEAEIGKSRKMQKDQFAIIKSSRDAAVINQKLESFMKREIEKLSEEERKSIGDIANHIKGQIKQINNPWFRYFLTYDPRPKLKRVNCPVLALGGGLDLQVPAEQNIKAIKVALKQGKNPPLTTRIFPGLNHLFQTAKTGSPLEYGNIEETISPAVLEMMGDWILH